MARDTRTNIVRHPATAHPLAALDIGTTKVACFIARPEGDGDMRVLGVGHYRARGLRNGVIVDIGAIETGIRHAVEAAEEMANIRIERIAVNVTGGRPESEIRHHRTAVQGGTVTENDLAQLILAGRAEGAGEGRTLLHCIPLDYALDGHGGIHDPRGLHGRDLSVSLHAISAQESPVHNVSLAVERCHLEVERHVVSAYAAGLACLVDDERALGVTVIDMGGGCTGIACFKDGHLIHVDSIPVGGVHVTNDIARGLSTPVTHAERLKTLYGNTLASPSDDREILKVPLVGEDEPGAAHQVPRSMLVQIVRPRIEETFELIRAHLETAGMDRLCGRRVVLTGGASQLSGLREVAGQVLDKQVRIGRPHGLKGLAASAGGPGFSVCAGLLRHAALHRRETPEIRAAKTQPTGRFGRLGQWLLQNI